MAEKEDIHTCEDDDPNRCQRMTPHGQCNKESYINSDFCLLHGGNKKEEGDKKKALNNYRLNRFQVRISELAHNTNVKNLRDEIGILRILLEERFNQCENPSELLVHSGVISDLVMKIQSVIASCHKLETAMGLVLDKEQVAEIADRIIQSVSKRVKDPEVLKLISDDISGVI